MSVSPDKQKLLRALCACGDNSILGSHISGYEKRKITRKVLADKLGVTAFHSSEIVDKRRILDRVMKAIAEKIGRGHRESYPAHNLSSPKWKTLKR